MQNYLTKYLTQRDENKNEANLRDKCLQELKREAARSKKKKKGLNEKRKRLREAAKNSLSNLKDSMDQFLPTSCLMALQVSLTLQAYTYHTDISMIQLCWVLISFAAPLDVSLYLSVIVLLPIYFFEFIMIYGLRIPLVQDLTFMLDNRSYFPQSEYMKFPIFE